MYNAAGKRLNRSRSAERAHARDIFLNAPVSHRMSERDLLRYRRLSVTWGVILVYLEALMTASFRCRPATPCAYNEL